MHRVPNAIFNTGRPGLITGTGPVPRGDATAAGEQPARGGGQQRRIEAATHENSDAIGPEPIRYGLGDQLVEPIDVVAVAPVVHRLVDRQRPVSTQREPMRGPRQRVSRRQPLDIVITGDSAVLIAAKQQEIRDGYIVQPVRHGRMPAQALQRIAEHEPGRDVGIVEGLDAHVIPSAEQSARAAVPDSEREIAQQVLDAAFAPAKVGPKDQLDVWSAVQFPR